MDIEISMKMQILNYNASFTKGKGTNQSIVVLNSKNAKFLIIYNKTTGAKISKKIIKLITQKKQKKIICFIIARLFSKIKKNTYFLDSACSNHMTRQQQYFTKLGENFSSKVKLGDNKLHNIKDKWIITTNSKWGNSKFIYDMLYVLNLSQNR